MIFLEKINVNRTILEDTAYGLAKFGDHFWIRSITPEDGITEITPIDVRQVKDRIEFSAIDELEKLYNKKSLDWCSNSND